MTRGEGKVGSRFSGGWFFAIASDPPGKKVLIAGKTRGTTPLSLKLPVGTHSIEVDGVSRTVVVLEGGAPGGLSMKAFVSESCLASQARPNSSDTGVYQCPC